LLGYVGLARGYSQYKAAVAATGEGEAVKVELEMCKPVPLRYRGVLLRITGSDGKQVGVLRIGSATAEWMKGQRTKEGRGTKFPLSKLIDFLNTVK
jgi:hypothetical protein